MTPSKRAVCGVPSHMRSILRTGGEQGCCICIAAERAKRIIVEDDTKHLVPDLSRDEITKLPVTSYQKGRENLM